MAPLLSSQVVKGRSAIEARLKSDMQKGQSR
jgi:hypothetical protein